MRYALALVALAIGTHGALAMGPSMTDFPSVKSLGNCERWAASQDDEARTIWGLLPSGKTSSEVAKMRLTLYCIGDDVPGLATVGTSVGAAEDYCKDHSDFPVCRKVGTESKHR